MAYKVAVVGATGNVGREMLKTLAEREFPISEVVALASARSVRKEVSFGDTGKVLVAKDLATYDFSDTDIALFSPGGKISAEFAPKAAAQGCVVIDNTSHFRMQEDIPLVVPEVNAEALKDFRKRNIIANPNCSTIQMLVALKPLDDVAIIKRIVVSTYQSVSGAGKSAMDELYEQTKAMYAGEVQAPINFSARIAYNVIPQIDVFMEDGSTKEEWKMVQETKKILSPTIEVSATCVRTPVFIGHAESVNVEFESEMTPKMAREILLEAPGVIVADRDDIFATPVDCVGEDAVFVSRIRKDPTIPFGLNMWVVADNLRKGAALNAVQIAEELIQNYGLMPKAKAAA